MAIHRSVVILAGGQGRRMGGANKALLPLGGETLLERQLREAAKWSDEIIVVSNEPIPLLQGREVRVVSDIYPGEGPLAGLHAGLSATNRPYSWVLACDQPHPNALAAEWLLERMTPGCQAVVPIIGGRRQPLHAVYRREAARIAETLLTEGKRRMNELLSAIKCETVEEAFFSERGMNVAFADDIDTPDQYEREIRLHYMEPQ